MPNPTAPAEFRGFDDWVEVFTAGRHTDAHGNVRTWTDAELDEIVATHSATEPAPLVVGHPTTDAPAYGWTAELKRAGSKLLAKFAQVHDAVDQAARDGRYRNRSIKVAKTGAGWKLIHVGLLGAAPPAVPGLAPVYAAQADGEIYEFGGWAEAGAVRAIGRAFRMLREWLIGQYGQETADRAIGTDVPDILNSYADELAREAQPPRLAAFSAQSDPPAQEPKMPDPTFSQADIDRAIADAVAAERTRADAAETRARQVEFTQRLADNRQFVSRLVSDDEGQVRLTPAEADGWAEALTFAQQLEASEFTFAAADGSEQKPQLYEFLKTKLTALQPRLQLGRERATQEPDTVDLGDATALAKAAGEYQAAEAAKGHTINIGQAVEHIKSTRAAART